MCFNNYVIPTEPSFLQTNTAQRENQGQRLENHEELLSRDTPVQAVSSFVCNVCRACFSQGDLWGSRHNLDLFLSSVDAYLRLGRQESLSLAQLSRGMRLYEMKPWKELANDSMWRSHSLSSIKEQDDLSGAVGTSIRLVVCEQATWRLLFWIFSQFINPLVGACFYVTEVEGHGAQVHYYRKAVWANIVRLGLHQMKENFVQVGNF
jgi:hypothetical protein